MRGDEKRVVDTFCRWLEKNGWIVDKEVNFIDIVARKGPLHLYAETKGRTAAIGLDVDTLYGQLLRRIPNGEVGKAVFGVVVPEEGKLSALRVQAQVRKLLNIVIFVVDLNGNVEQIKP